MRLITIIITLAALQTMAAPSAWQAPYDDTIAKFQAGDNAAALAAQDNVAAEVWSTAPIDVRVGRLSVRARAQARIGHIDDARASAEQATVMAIASPRDTPHRSTSLYLSHLAKTSIDAELGDWSAAAIATKAAYQVMVNEGADAMRVDYFAVNAISAHYNAGEYQQAVDTTDALAPGMATLYQPTAQLWGGMAAEKIGDDTSAQRLYLAALAGLSKHPRAAVDTMAFGEHRAAFDYLLSHGKTLADLSPIFVGYFKAVDGPVACPTMLDYLCADTSPTRIAFEDAGDLLKRLKRWQKTHESRINARVLRKYRDQLESGGNFKALTVSRREIAIGEAVGGYWGALIKGDAKQAALIAFDQFAAADTDASYKLWAERGVTPALRVLDQCYNGSSLEFRKWAIGESDTNPIDGLRQ